MIVEHHNVVDILVYNDNGELALQKRSSEDRSFPEHWDFSAGGHIDENENNTGAASRELSEELGVAGTLIFISQEHLQYSAGEPNTQRAVDIAIYKMKHNGPFKINSKEVKEIGFFKLDAVQKMIDDGEKFHPEFLLIWVRGLANEIGKFSVVR